MESISRTQKKKEALARQKIGEQLVLLSDAQFAALELPDDLMEAVTMARQIKQHEARRRQLQYIGRLMRQIDPAVIDAAVEKVSAEEARQKRWFKQVERWRDQLVAGSRECFDRLVERYPQIDVMELAGLIDSAKGLDARMDRKLARRQLFRFLSRLEQHDKSA